MALFGPMLDRGDCNRFYWLRGFTSIEARDRQRAELYGGKVWLDELQSLAMPLLRSTDYRLTDLDASFLDDFMC